MPENKANRLKNLARSPPEGKAARMVLEIENANPLDLLLAVIRNNSLPVMMRVEAARACAPYFHQKKPIAIEGTDKPLISQDDLRGLSAKELQTMRNLLLKMGVGIADASGTTH
jgi:hypothetical protein